MANYQRVRGVGYCRFVDDEDEPATEQRDAKVEEMYFDGYSGELDIRMETDDGFISVSIPVTHSKKWREFVGSLPERSDG